MRSLAALAAMAFLGIGCDGTGTSGDGPPPVPLLDPPQSFEIPGRPFVAHAALWSSVYSKQGLLPETVNIVFFEREHACRSEDLALFEGERFLEIIVAHADWGDCAVADPLSADPWSPRSGGCRAVVLVEQEPEASSLPDRLTAVGGQLHLEPASSGAVRLSGHLLFPIDAASAIGCSPTERFCLCEKDGHEFTCQAQADDLNCCNDDAAIEALPIDTVVEHCAVADFCRNRPCASLLTSGRSAVPDFDCETACSNFVAVCNDCVGCPSQKYCDLVNPCSQEFCLSRCHSGFQSEPERLSLACLAGSMTCDAWQACMLE